MRAFAVAALVAALGGSAWAQDEAWSRYDAAIEAFAEGRDAEALAVLEGVRARWPDHPAAALSAEAARIVEAKRSGHAPPPDASRASLRRAPGAPLPAGDPLDRAALAALLRAEVPTSFARAELSFVQTLNGVAFGVSTCLLARCDDVRAGVLSALLGGGAGLAASLLLTPDGITPGRALAIDAGAGWGAWNGLALANAMDETQTGPDLRFGALLALQLAGTWSGWLVGDRLAPSAGDVSLATFGGIWSGVLYLLVRSAAQWSSTDRTFWLTFAATTDVGLALGALAATRFPMSRGRVYVLDAGGLLGLLLGYASVVLVNGAGSPPDVAFHTAGAVEAVGGIALAAWLTRAWDVPEGRVVVGLLPMAGGAGVSGSVAW